MPLTSFMAREVGFKIVYCGAPFAGKTACLAHIANAYPRVKGKVTPLVSPHPSEVAFDFVPRGMGTIRGFAVRLSLFTLRGDGADDAAWTAMLRGADALVFVVDSQRARLADNVAAWTALGAATTTLPTALLYNKRDLPDVVSPTELAAALHAEARPWFEGVATEGSGVYPSLKAALKPSLDAFLAARP